MRQPWATLFAGYEDHWLLGQYLRGDGPDWWGIENDSKLDSLSSGEITLLWVARAFDGNRTATVADVILKLDRSHRMRVAAALCLS